MSRKILDSTLESASFNIIFQIFLRCLTFFLNAFILRYVTSAVVGVMNVRLLLLESTVLFLSRDAFRRAALSQTESHSWPQIINLVWLTVPLTVVISVFFGFIWLHILELPSSDITSHYSIGVWSILISCVIEMLSEPLFIASRAFSFTKLKVALDSLTVLVRTIIFVVWIVINSKQAVIAFSAAQIVANTLYTVGFYIYFYMYIQENNKKKNQSLENFIIKQTDDTNPDVGMSDDKEKEAYDIKEEVHEIKEHMHPRLKRRQSSLIGFNEPFPFSSLLSLFPSLSEGENWIHPNSAQLTWSFFKQGVLKQILTEGEHYVMTLFSVMSFKEQGMYDVVNNLGSLVVRFLFCPVEDSLYLYFTLSVKRESKIKDQNQERMKEAATVFSQALKCVTGIGLIIFIFGQSYSTLLLHLYIGETATSGPGPTLLRFHSFSVLILGINGITECYAFSTMTSEQLNKYNYLMAVFSLSFLVISLGLTRFFGGMGFIFANCCIMSARIAHSIAFVKSRYSETSFQPLEGLIPNKYFLIMLAVSLFVTKLSENYCRSWCHFLIGVTCFIITVIVWCIQERELVVLAIEKWKNKKSKKE